MLVAAGYTFLNAFLAWSTLSRIRAVDPVFRLNFPVPRFTQRYGGLAIALIVLLNLNLPRGDYPDALQWRIWIARIMMWLWPFLICLLLLLSNR